MSSGEKEVPPATGGRRKDGKPYKDGNTRDDGSYAVGKNRAPVATRFTEGDGRKRGKREKGVKNADTEFARELKRTMTIKENGVDRNVSKSLGVDMRLLDNALRKGNNKAIEMVDQRRRRIAEASEHNRRYHTLSDQEILETYLRQRAEELSLDPSLLGDPDPEADASHVPEESGEEPNSG